MNFEGVEGKSKARLHFSRFGEKKHLQSFRKLGDHISAWMSDIHLTGVIKKRTESSETVTYIFHKEDILSGGLLPYIDVFDFVRGNYPVSKKTLIGLTLLINPLL